MNLYVVSVDAPNPPQIKRRSALRPQPGERPLIPLLLPVHDPRKLRSFIPPSSDRSSVTIRADSLASRTRLSAVPSASMRRLEFLSRSAVHSLWNEYIQERHSDYFHNLLFTSRTLTIQCPITERALYGSSKYWSSS